MDAAPREEPTLPARVAAHLADGKTVLVQTHTRATRFQPKHAAMMKASQRDPHTLLMVGGYRKGAPRWVIVLPQYVFFEE